MSDAFVTTPIYYVNDKPHFGHAYTTVMCDVYARFHRAVGDRVVFSTGTDEHGQKIQRAAEKAGKAPQDFVDALIPAFHGMNRTLDISGHAFIRTTEPRHEKAVVAVWDRLKANGYIYRGKYKGWYATRDEAYYSEDEIVDGKAPTGAPVEWFEEDCFFFKMSALKETLLKYYAAHPDFVVPQGKYNEVVGLVKQDLPDLCVTRSTIAWGIPVPDDPKSVFYVWLDALVNYMTVLGYPDDTADMRDFWPNAVHVIGKDILKFHAVYWPAFLLAAGLRPPKRVAAHGWWLSEGEKMSKSLGNVMYPGDLVEKYGLDQLRYYMLREVPFGADGNFTNASMARRANDELANEFGNLVQRVVSFGVRNFGGKVGGKSESALVGNAKKLKREMAPLIESFQFGRALDAAWDVVRQANRYIDEQAPWTVRKSDPARAEAVIWTLLAAIRELAAALEPVLIVSCPKIMDMIRPDGDCFSLVQGEVLFKKIEE